MDGGAWQPRAMSLPIFVVDAFTVASRSGAIRRPSCSGTATTQWMQRVAAEMRHSETAFVRARRRRRVRPALVHARGRGRPLRARDARERARAVRDRTRWRPTRPRRFHTRSGELRADARGRATAITLDFPRRRAGARRRRCPSSSTRSGSPDGELLAHRRRVLHVRRRRRGDRARRSRPTSPSSRALADVRGVYVTAPGDDGLRHRVAVLRAARRHRRGPGHRFDALRARRVLGRRGSARTSCARIQASARGGEVTVVRKGDRALLTGRATTVLARRATRVSGATRAARARRRGATPRGAQPSSSPARLDRTAVAERVAGLARLLVDLHRRARRARRRARSAPSSVISPPPARLQYVPGATSRVGRERGCRARCRRRR